MAQPLFSLLLAGLISAPLTAPGAQFVPGQILVKPRAGAAEKDFETKLHRHGAKQRRAIHHSNIRVLNLPEAAVPAVLAALNQDPAIEFAERDFIATATLLPNDPYVLSGAQWHLAKIQAPQAWDVTTGINSLVVAVLDSGINAAHPDFAGRLLPGYDFVWDDSDPADDFGHGTAVAGVVAAAGNNSIGVAGVAFGSRILPVKVMNASGFAYYSVIAQGIRHAVDAGARVINISIAGSSSSVTLQDAVNYAWSNNVVVVTAAGNTGNSAPQYPAACEHVVAVGATMPDDTRAAFSSSGNHLAVAAPGEAMYTTSRDLLNPYASWRGTSFASPVVAGVAALMISANPALDGAHVAELLKESADDLGAPGHDAFFGFGRVNAARAVNSAVNFEPTPRVELLSPTPGVGVSGQVSVQVAATASTTVARVECYANGVLIGTNTGPSATFAWTTTGLTNGIYTLQARAIDTAGASGYSAGVAVTVVNAVAAPATITGLTPLPDGSLRLSWSASENRSYRVQFATDLSNPIWQDLSPVITASGTSASFGFQPSATPQRFFRVQSLP